MFNGLLAQVLKKAFGQTIMLGLVVTVFDLRGDYIGWEIFPQTIPWTLVHFFVSMTAFYGALVLWKQDKAQRQSDRQQAVEHRSGYLD